MKKKIIFFLLMATMLLTLAGCGKKGETKQETNEEKETVEAEYKVEDYVTKVGNYIGLEYQKQDTTATEEDIQAEIKRFLQEHPEESKDRVIEPGDIADIDFVGKKDGVAFDGGTAKGYKLAIGSGSFIPGFEAGLVGKRSGQTVNLDLQFPETYHAEELKGAKVVFTVTINSVSAPVKEITDEFVAKNSDVKTVEALKEKFKKEIEERKQISFKNSIQGELIKKVIADSEIKEVPKSLMDTYVKNYINYYEEQATKNQVSLEEYLKMAMNMTKEEMEKKAEEVAKTLGEQKIVLEAIGKKEKMEVSEEEYNKELDEYFNASGFAGQMDKATFERSIGKEAIRELVVVKKVLKLMEDNAVAK